MEPGKQNRRTRNSLVIKTGTGKSWRILLTVLIMMKKTGLKTIEAFSWLFCQYPCSIFIQEFTPAFSFLLVASSFDTATLDHLRPETYTRQQYYCGGSCMRSAARQPPVASCGLWHGSAHLLNSVWLIIYLNLTSYQLDTHACKESFLDSVLGNAISHKPQV